MSDSALVAAMRPNAYGSSTIGVKKSAVCTIARSSVSLTTPASSAVSVATSTRGSVGAGQPGHDRAQVGGRELAAAAGAVGEGGQGGEHRDLSWRAVPQYTDAQIEAAVASLSEPGRLEEAQRLVASAAPQLQGILNQALESADWFGSAHQAEVLRAAGIADPDERISAVRTLIAEETGVSMLIGVAVGYELAHLLMDPTEGD